MDKNGTADVGQGPGAHSLDIPYSGVILILSIVSDRVVVRDFVLSLDDDVEKLVAILTKSDSQPHVHSHYTKRS